MMFADLTLQHANRRKQPFREVSPIQPITQSSSNANEVDRWGRRLGFLMHPILLPISRRTDGDREYWDHYNLLRYYTFTCPASHHDELARYLRGDNLSLLGNHSKVFWGDNCYPLARIDPS